MRSNFFHIARPVTLAVVGLGLFLVLACTQSTQTSQPTAAPAAATVALTAAPTVGQAATAATPAATKPATSTQSYPEIAGVKTGWPGIAIVTGGTSNRLWIIDAMYHRLVTTHDLGGPNVERTIPANYPNLRDVHAIAVNKDASVWYTVTAWDYKQSQAIKIDPKTLREVGRAPAGEGGHHNALSPDDKFLYVANQYGTTVSVIDTETMTKIKDLEVGKGADYITPSLYWVGQKIDTPHLFVSVDKNAQDNKVVAIDWKKNEVAKSIPMDGTTHGVNLTPDGKQAWACVHGAKEIEVIDVATLAVVKKVPYPDGGPIHMVFSPDGRYAFATGNAGLKKIDTSTYETVWVSPRGQAHLGITPDGKEVWTQNHGVDPVDRYPYLVGGEPVSASRVFDAETGALINEVPVQGTPHEMQFVPYGTLGLIPPKPTPAATAVPGDAVQGKVLFAKNCDECHPSGGSAMGPALKGRNLSVNAIRTKVRDGSDMMPRFTTNDLSDQQISDITAYINSLK